MTGWNLIESPVAYWARLVALAEKGDAVPALEKGVENLAPRLVRNPGLVRAVAPEAEAVLVRVGVQNVTRVAAVNLLRSVTVELLIPGGQVLLVAAGILVVGYCLVKLVGAADDAWARSMHDAELRRKASALNTALEKHVGRHCLCVGGSLAGMGNASGKAMAFNNLAIPTPKCSWPHCKSGKIRTMAA